MTYEIHPLSITDKAYPSLLKEIPDPPQTLYIRGNPAALSHSHTLAVVGSRKSSKYGHDCVQDLLPEAIQAGVCVVSGLAYGIDTLSHKACLQLNSPTVAVLGSGIDDNSLYPKDNLKVAHEIMNQGGAVISEYPPGTQPLRHHFPTRNRIIAGLSKATLLIQAALKSGTGITARLALEYNRDVLAVPGPINDPLSAGTNYLIQQGAIPVLTSEDILSVYNVDMNTKDKTLPLRF